MRLPWTRWGTVVATGEFTGTVDFGGGPLESAFGSADIFLAKYATNVIGVGEPPRPHALSVSAYPNPFSSGTMVHYIAPERGRVRVRVYDTRGHQVATLVNEERSAGPYTVRWDGRDDRGARVGAGVYFLMVEQAGSMRTTRITLLD
jgi:flagellar hook capping protein FlgD